MKKRVLSLFTLSMIFLLCGCAKTVSETGNTASVIGESVDASTPVSESVEESEKTSVSEASGHNYAFSEEEDMICEMCSAGIDMDSLIDEFGIELPKDPVNMVKTLFPSLSEKNAEFIKAYEDTGYVAFTEGEDVLSVEVLVLQKTEDGENLYCPNYAFNMIPEEALRTNEEFEKVTPGDFEKAMDFETFYQISLDEKEDTVEENLYLMEESEDGKVKCYGLTHANGFVIKLGDSFAPVYACDDPGWWSAGFINAADYDNDGEDECAFILNDGRGTGFFTECLYIVDPGEENQVSFFNNIVDMSGSRGLSNAGCLYDRVGYEYDEEKASVSYWLDDNGKKTDKGSFAFDEEYAKLGYKYLCFGDQLYFERDDDKIVFSAIGGFSEMENGYVDYEYRVVLKGDMVYNNGSIKVKNLTVSHEMH